MEAGDGAGELEPSIVLGEGLEAPDRCGESETMPERPESMFKDWAMEVCIRSSRKIVGVRDQYYYDLMSHHHFRSKKDLEYFLLTGMIRRYTPKSKKSDTNKCSNFRSLIQDDFVLKQQSELRFDFKNHPTKVSWVFTNFSKGMRTSCKEGYRSLHGIHGWPQWKTSTVACMNFIRERDGGLELSIVLGEALEALDMCGELETMPERPKCMVKNWAMEVCIRNSSKIVGLRDQYYYDLMSHHHFQSKKDVEYFLLTGMIRRYTPKSKKYTTNKLSELRYDFKNHPTKVSWVLTNFSEGMRTSCKEGCRSLHGIHGWPQWKTSTVACMNFIREGDGGLDLSIVQGEGLEAPDRCGESETMLEGPESLFKDWAMEVCIRSSSKIVGVRDQYYYDLMSHHHLRSKKDVEYFLLTEMIRRYTLKSKKPATNKCIELSFDFKNHPTKVSWVLTNFPEGMRTSCKEGCRSRHGIHGWPQWKTSTVVCMNFSSDGGDTNTQILK